MRLRARRCSYAWGSGVYMGEAGERARDAGLYAGRPDADMENTEASRNALDGGLASFKGRDAAQVEVHMDPTSALSQNFRATCATAESIYLLPPPPVFSFAGPRPGLLDTVSRSVAAADGLFGGRRAVGRRVGRAACV